MKSVDQICPPRNLRPSSQDQNVQSYRADPDLPNMCHIKMSGYVEVTVDLKKGYSTCRVCLMLPGRLVL